MPIFDLSNDDLLPVEQKNFAAEKELQTLIEKNLGVVFNCRLVATEFSTGAQHAGRIDTLALSEENNPVLIEYKKVESSELINQSLFYLSWIYDHRGDYEIAVQKALGNGTVVDWSDVRVICLAPNYKKYDLHAVQMMGANIELWRYRLFSNASLYIEKIYHRGFEDVRNPIVKTSTNLKNPVMVEAGKKAALTRKKARLNDGTDLGYSFEVLVNNKPEDIKKLAEEIREFTLGLDSTIEEEPRKHYVAYTTARNFLCMIIQRQNIKLWLGLKPSDIPESTKGYRDVSSIGHHGTGNVEITVSTRKCFEEIKKYIAMAYNRVGG